MLLRRHPGYAAGYRNRPPADAAPRQADQAPRAPTSTSPPALTAIVWMQQRRGDRQPRDLRCPGRTQAYPSIVIRPGPGTQLCSHNGHGSTWARTQLAAQITPVCTVQGRRSTSRWRVPIDGYTRPVTTNPMRGTRAKGISRSRQPDATTSRWRPGPSPGLRMFRLVQHEREETAMHVQDLRPGSLRPLAAASTASGLSRPVSPRLPRRAAGPRSAVAATRSLQFPRRKRPSPCRERALSCGN
jgi:hypothetical protein